MYLIITTTTINNKLWNMIQFSMSIQSWQNRVSFINQRHAQHRLGLSNCRKCSLWDGAEEKKILFKNEIVPSLPGFGAGSRSHSRSTSRIVTIIKYEHVFCIIQDHSREFRVAASCTHVRQRLVGWVSEWMREWASEREIKYTSLLGICVFPSPSFFRNCISDWTVRQCELASNNLFNYVNG